MLLQSQIECLLEEMRIKLSSVASDLLSVGLCILWALARGGRPEEIGGFGRRALAASRGAAYRCLGRQPAADAPGTTLAATGTAAIAP